jgi:HPt (histidine-containing phosphotransfer) domain-containing protein
MRFEEILSLMLKETGLEKEDAISLYHIFFEMLPDTIKSLEEATKRNEFVNVQKIAHQLKGSSLNLRIDELSSLALKLEMVAKTNEATLCMNLIKDITVLMNTFNLEVIR